MASDRSSKLARWRALVLQPTWIAGAISVGFHGVLFAAGPTFSNLNLDTLADPDALATNRRVPLVELTPEEQQRHLPDFSNSFYSLSSLDDFETTAPPTQSVPFSPRDNTATTTTRRGPHPRTTFTQQIPFRTTIGPGTPLPTGGTTERNTPATATTPDETASTPAEDATADASTPSDAAASTPTESSAQDLALDPNSPAEGNASGQRPAAEQGFAYNSDTLEEAWGRWFEQLDQGEISPQAQPLPAERLPLAYVPSQEACPSIDQDGLVAALVNAEGNLIEGSVKLLKSTGNDALDAWAQTDGVNTWANAFKFPEESQPQTAYLLEVFVERAEICD
ncbi:MAG: hypothetical protein ACFB0C_16415 [Leptolyngbyaceae cyanobacterium]